jgi:hypothetical protein
MRAQRDLGFHLSASGIDANPNARATKIVAHVTHSITKRMDVFKSDHTKSAHELPFSSCSLQFAETEYNR